ncbi:haloacid dehalogenase-like hydrolase [Methylophaga lonarensis MPL]|uniref:Haloacid dehalogenase-like hydrolase n=1 Tax=Methylophaga lonarensis MPL TaxID=1286106 RepID=M7NXH4_9GAMM|nr:HAD hydrolase-like protein [Methylophaga lonarensis]EMR11876.1 haloacid dehalogenase-like hydrolase [Methylophaga lonarensis MPL]
MQDLQAVIFNLDAALTEIWAEGHRQAFNRAFQQAGLDWYWDESMYQMLVSKGTGRQCLQYYLENFHLQCGFAGDLKTMLDKLYMEQQRIYADWFKMQAMPLKKGLTRLVAELKQSSIRPALVSIHCEDERCLWSSSPPEEQICDGFEAIALASQLKNKQAAADVYRDCLKQLGVDASACIAIVDSQAGLSPANEAGIAAVLLVSHHSNQKPFATTGGVIESQAEMEIYPASSIVDAEADIVDLPLLKQLHYRAIYA